MPDEIKVTRFVIERVLHVVRPLLRLEVAVKCVDIALVVVPEICERNRFQRHIADEGIE